MRLLLVGATPRTEPPLTAASIAAARAAQLADRALHPELARKAEAWDRDEVARVNAKGRA